MRKRQKLADAMGLSSELTQIEVKLHGRQLTLEDAAVIDAIAARVHALERGKIIIEPSLLHRVRALTGVARRLREIQAQRTQGSAQ